MSFDVKVFRKKLQKAIGAASLIVKQWHPEDLSQIRHRYEDKFCLVEDVTNAALNTTRRTMELFFVPSFSIVSAILPESLPLSLFEEDGGGLSVCLRYSAIQRCHFMREEERKYSLDGVEIEKGEKLPSEYQRRKVFLWSVEVQQNISLFVTGPHRKEKENSLFSQEHISSVVILTESERMPFAKIFTHKPLDLDLSWIFHFFVLDRLRESQSKYFQGSEGKEEGEEQRRRRQTRIGSFQILEEGKRTPIRNPSVAESMVAFQKFLRWCKSVKREIEKYQKLRSTWALKKKKKKNLQRIYSFNKDVFLPVFPFFNSRSDDVESLEGGWRLLLDEHGKSLKEILQEIEIEWEKDEDQEQEEEEEKKKKKRKREEEKEEGEISIFDTWCANLAFRLEHLAHICQSYLSSLEFIEWMLYSQIVTAIGKEISASDFAAFMKWHTPRFFLPQFHPCGFSHPVRSSSSSLPLSSEGIIRIEEKMSSRSSSTLWEAIDTIGRTGKIENGVRVRLNAASEMRCQGHLSVHSHIRHQFGRGRFRRQKEPSQSMRLCVRAKQFSSFIVLVGRIGQGGWFDVEYGLLVRNKDQVFIPFKVEVIPSIKEFKEAISSLSPQQQEFSQMFRGMQLGNTLWTMCVVQVRPQIEKILGLLPGSLLKEIELTQDILDLLLEYHFPIDLLSVSLTTKNPDDEEGEKNRRIEEVRMNVEKLKRIIEQEKNKLLKESVEYQKTLWDVLRKVPSPVQEYNWAKIDEKRRENAAEGEIVVPPFKQKKTFLNLFSKEKGASERSRQIDQQLRNAKKKMNQTLNIAIIGLEGSGKATLMKQLQILYLGSFPDEEKKEYFRILKGNLFSALLDLCLFAGEMGIMAEIAPDLEPRIVVAKLQSMELDSPFLRMMNQLWKQVGRDCPQKMWRWKYLLDNLDRFCSLSPSELSEIDILHLKGKTCQPRNLEFSLQNYDFCCSHVPKMTKESLYYLEGCTAIIFMIPLDEFHITGQSGLNRLVEAIYEFEELVYHREAEAASLIVFLKSDDLEEKLKLYTFANYFPEFTGQNEGDAVVHYVISKLSSLSDDKSIFSHKVVIHDTHNIKVVFSCVREILVCASLSMTGLCDGFDLSPRRETRRGKDKDKKNRREHSRIVEEKKAVNGRENQELTKKSEQKNDLKQEKHENQKEEKKENSQKEENQEKKDQKKEDRAKEEEQVPCDKIEEKKLMSIDQKRTPMKSHFSEKNIAELPSLLEKLFEKHGVDGIIRPNILHLDSTWERIQQKSLLARPTSSSFSQQQQERERKMCIDLLDALTRSGGVEIDDVEVHVLLSWTFSAELSVMDTLVQQSVNPIERMEDVLVALGSGLFDLSPEGFVQHHLQRMTRLS